MKQHITQSQLDEISEDQQKKLPTQWIHQDHDRDSDSWCYSCSERVSPEDKTQYAPALLSIGQIIEFIQTWGQGKIIIGIYEVPGEEEGNIKWGIKLYLKIKNKEGKDTMGEGKYFGVEKELCDALWETVKEILE